VLNLHGLDVHDLAAVFALGENTFSLLAAYLEVFSLAASTCEFPVVFVFFCYHSYHYIFIDFWVLNGNYYRNIAVFLHGLNAEGGYRTHDLPISQ